MRELGIPNQLIGVECLVAIAALAIHVDVCGEVAAPRDGDLCVPAIIEIPRGEVAGCLQAVLGTGVSGTAIERETEPFVAETQ